MKKRIVLYVHIVIEFFIRRMKMNEYSILTTATVTTEYIVKAKNKEEAQEKYYNCEWEQSNELDIHNEVIDTIDLDKENKDDTN